MKDILAFLLIIIPSFLIAQAPTANSLVQLHSVTTAERNSITGVAEGSLIFDSDEQTLYTYTSSVGWKRLQSEPNTYTGSFILSSATASISITDVPFKPSKITFNSHANIESFNIDTDSGVDDNTFGLQNSFGNMDGFARDDAGSIAQQVIYSGGSGNSINDISRYASNLHCIGIRFGDQNGADLGKILGQLNSFDNNGFTIGTNYSNGTVTSITGDPRTEIDPADVQAESLVVLYTAYR